MPRPQKITDERMIEAIRLSQGLITVAARKLGCDRKTIYSRLAVSETVKEALDEARDFTLDVAEAKLFEAVRNGESWAVQYMLSTVGKERGYTTRSEVTGKDAGPIATKTEIVRRVVDTSEETD